MTLAPPMTLTLTQTKRFSGSSPRTERFVVQERIVGSVATTNRVHAAFVLGPAAGIDRERLLRVVNLKDPIDAALVAQMPTTENTLTFFRDQVLDIAPLVAQGDILRVTLPPGEWATASGLLDTQDFLVADVDLPNQRIELETAFLWAAQNLTYTVLAPDLITVRTGPNTVGMTERQNTALTEWRCDQVTVGFATAAEALDHVTSVQAFVASLSVQLRVDVQEYLDTGGNPYVNTF